MSATATVEEVEAKIIGMVMDGYKNVRYGGVCDENAKILTENHREGVENILTLEETKAMLKRACENWKVRHEITPKVGKGKHIIVSYEKIKRITIPLENGHLLFFSVDSDKDAHIKDIMKIIEYVQNTLAKLPGGF